MNWEPGARAGSVRTLASSAARSISAHTVRPWVSGAGVAVRSASEASVWLIREVSQVVGMVRVGVSGRGAGTGASRLSRAPNVPGPAGHARSVVCRGPPRVPQRATAGDPVGGHPVHEGAEGGCVVRWEAG